MEQYGVFSGSNEPPVVLTYYLQNIRDVDRLFQGYSESLSTLSNYLKAIHNTEYLNEEKEQELFRRYKVHNDPESKELLIKAHLPFVVKLARRISFKCPETMLLGDLIGSGNIGLIEAVEKFDMDRGVRFFVFARKKINTFIWREVYDHSRTIKLSRSVCDMMNILKKKYPSLRWGNEEAPSMEQITQDLYEEFLDAYIAEHGTAPDEEFVANMRWELKHAYWQIITGDKPPLPLPDDDSAADMRYGEYFISKYESPDEALALKELCIEIESFLKDLPPLESEMLKRCLFMEEELGDITAEIPINPRKASAIIWNHRVQLKRRIDTKRLENEPLQSLTALFNSVPTRDKSAKSSANGWTAGDTRREQVVDEIERRLRTDASSLFSNEDLHHLFRFKSVIPPQHKRLMGIFKQVETELHSRFEDMISYSVNRIMRKFFSHGVMINHDDLRQEAHIALMAVIEKFNPDRGFKLATFAQKRIHGAIVDVARKALGGRGKFRITFVSAEEHFSRESDRGIQEFDIPDTRISHLEEMQQDQSRELLHQTMTQALARLPENEKKVMELLYPLHEHEHQKVTLKEVGNQVGLSESRVSQLHTKALCRIRALLSPTFKKTAYSLDEKINNARELASTPTQLPPDLSNLFNEF
jgi:RNA polymerase sigma factor (sigma-70 family)